MAEVLGGIVAKVRGAITDWSDLILAILGAGASAAITEVIRSWFPEQTEGLTDEALGAIAGFVMLYWGGRIHRMIEPFGLGVFLSSVGAYTSEWVASVIAMLKKK